MWQPWFHYPLIVFIPIALLMHQILCSSSSCSMLPYFFYFIFFFFINNHWRWCWILVLSFELWLHASCQKVLIKDVMNYLSFWKFQLKCSWTNVLCDSKGSVSFVIQLLWGSVWLDIFVLQPHMVTNLQTLRVSSLFVKLSFHVLLSFFHCMRSLFLAFL